VKKVEAYKISGGDYYKIRGNTYPIRKLLSELGGVWEPNEKYWTLHKVYLDEINAKRHYKVEVEKHCHCETDKDLIEIVDDDQLLSGYVIVGCSYCDKSYQSGDKVKIIKLIEEV
jgi:hypothetical protein